MSLDKLLIKEYLAIKVETKRWLLIAVGIALLVVVLIVGVLQTRLFYLGRATEERIPSLSDSYVFGSPLIATARDQEKITISVFILDARGRGVAGKKPSVKSQPALNLKSVQPETDKYGQAIFEVTSGQPGQFVISASLDGEVVSQTVTLTFR